MFLKECIFTIDSGVQIDMTDQYPSRKTPNQNQRKTQVHFYHTCIAAIIVLVDIKLFAVSKSRTLSILRNL